MFSKFKLYLMSLGAISTTLPFYAFSSESKIVAEITEEKAQNSYSSLIPHNESTQFLTGRNIWNQNVGQFEVFLVGQYRERHAQKELRPFLDYLATADQQDQLRCPIRFKHNNILEDLTLEFLINKQTIGQYYLLHAFDKGIVELLDSSLSLLKKAKYLRSDLEVLQTYFFKACAVLKRIEFITNKLFGHSTEEFNLEKFTRNFDQTIYTPAHLINAFLKEEINKIRINNNGIFSIDQYIKYYAKLYYLSFSNQFIFIKMHLGDAKNPDKKGLNRTNINGSLERDAFDLESLSLPSLQGLEEAPSKKKKRKKKKKSAAIVTEHTTGTSSAGLLTTGKEQLKEEVAPTSSVVIQSEGSQAISTPPLTNEVSYQTSKTPAAAALSSAPNISSSSSQSAAPISPKSQSFSPSNEISKLNQLEEILRKHDGGATAGMKTRHFLRLASALEKLGYFSRFEMDQKEVRIKVDPTDQNSGLVTVMHTNHTNTSKDTGITRPTAAKMNEVIDILKEKAEKEETANSPSTLAKNK